MSRGISIYYKFKDILEIKLSKESLEKSLTEYNSIFKRRIYTATKIIIFSRLQLRCSKNHNISATYSVNRN